MLTFNPFRLIVLVTGICCFIACTKKVEDEPSNPTIIITKPATAITSTSVASGGELLNAAGVTDRGIIWGTDSNSLNISSPNKISNGAGAAGFTDTIKNLQPNTVYFIRAFANYGSGVAYGAAITFTTLATEPTVFVTGYHGLSAVYWKNGKLVTLPDGYAANGIALVGTDVYVAGSGFIDASSRATWWKNESFHGLSDGNRYATGKAIQVSGNDVYVCGYDYNMDGAPIPNAKYWKNGMEFTLSDGANICGLAHSMWVSGSDAYVAGFITNRSSSIRAAVYWKNGLPVFLTDSTKVLGEATSIFVNGNDVYIAGTVSTGLADDAVTFANYWQNGATVRLTHGVEWAGASSICVNGSDVYVAGYEYAPSGFLVAKYWKNGVPVSLTDGTSNGAATSIYVIGSDVYVAGFESPADTTIVARYWKNGLKQPLEISETFSSATAIVVQ